MIKSTNVSTKFANTTKGILLNDFLEDYRANLVFYVDYIWANFDPNKKFPSIPKDVFLVDTSLSARARKCAMGQALGMVKAVKNRQAKLRKKLSWAMKNKKKHHKLQRQCDILDHSKPMVGINTPAELNSICANYLDTNNSFDGFLELKSIGKKYGKIRIPVKHHKHYNKLSLVGKLMKSFLVSRNMIGFRFEFGVPNLKTNGKIIGVDQGVSTLITMSDGQITGCDTHGHTFSSIMKKLSEKQPGSKAFTKTKNHMINHINAEINSLDFTDISEVRLEKLHKMFHKRKGKHLKFLRKFKYPTIRKKMEDVCLMGGVRFIEQASHYRSQRCSGCGYVHKQNRKGKEFVCVNCGYANDADLNAALNHAGKLPVLADWVWRRHMSKDGFFWKESGLFMGNGKVLTVSSGQNNY